MTPDEELLAELKKINIKLDKFSGFWKNSWWNFYSGIFRSLGSLFGTAVITAIIVYLLSKSGITQSIQNLISPFMIK